MDWNPAWDSMLLYDLARDAGRLDLCERMNGTTPAIRRPAFHEAHQLYLAGKLGESPTQSPRKHMTKAAKKTISPDPGKYLATMGSDECKHCGHPPDAHDQVKSTCPATPPAKSEFKKSLDDATGVTAAKELEQKAAANFERAPEPGTAETISVKYISPRPRNPRTNLGDLSELAKSLDSLKVMLQPIIVRELPEPGAGYEIVSGHRRFAAAVDLGWEEVPCLVHELTDVQALEINLTEQINRKDLTPLEEGEACRSLIELSGYDTKQVAAKLGQSVSWVTKRLSLCGLAAEVKKSLGKGEITLTLATALAALPSQKMQLEAVETLEHEQRQHFGQPLTTEDKLETLRTEFCRPLKGAPWKLVDADLVPEAGPCSTCPKNSVNNQAPGLFDNVKAPPTCSNLPCFESKMAAAWALATVKYKAAGAKILPHGESTTKLFNVWHDEVKLNHGSRYVFADAVVQEDGDKRSWAQITAMMKPEDRPTLHIAQDPKGGIHELFVEDKATAAIADHLALKWAKKAVRRNEAPSAKPASNPSKVSAQKREIIKAVAKEILGVAAKKMLGPGLDLPAARLMACDTAEALTATWDDFFAATGIKGGGAWLNKHATTPELVLFTWWLNASERFVEGNGSELDKELIDLAKRAGLDAKAMVKAKIDDEKKAKTK